MDPKPEEQANQPSQPTAADTVSQITEAAKPAIEQAAANLPPEAKSIEIHFEEDLVLVVSAETINDMRFLEMYEEITENQLKLPKLFKFMFGEAEYNSIFTYYESRGQKFTITKMGEVFGQLEKDLNANPDFLN